MCVHNVDCDRSGHTLVNRHCIRIMEINPLTALIRELTMFALI